MVTVRPWGRNGKSGWEVDINTILPDGRNVRQRVKSPVSSKSGSESWGKRREAEIIRKGGVRALASEAKPEVPTVTEFAERFLAYSVNQNKPSTVHAKRWILRVHLLPWFGETRLDAIGPEEVDAYKTAKRAEGLEPKSVNNHLTALRKLLNLAVEFGALARAPKVRGFAVRVGPLSPEEYLDQGEAARIIAAAPPEWRTMIAVALNTGLRLGELLALRWSDVDLGARRLVVRRTLWQGQEGVPKGGRARVVDLNATAHAALSAHRHLRSEYVFTDGQGSRLTHSIVKDVVPSACHAAGLPKRITWHALRHSFASHLAMANVPLKAIQELLGHASLEMTLRYAHLTPDARRSAVHVLDRPGAVVEPEAA